MLPNTFPRKTETIFLARIPIQQQVNILLRATREIVDDAQKIDTRRYEEAKSAIIRVELLTTLGRLIARAQKLMVRIFEHYEAQHPEPASEETMPELSFETRLDQLVATGDAAQKIADIAFIARLELARKNHDLVHLATGTDSWELIAACASARRRILKSATVLERAICDHEGIPPECDWYITSTRRSVGIRRAYAVFRKALHVDDPPTARDIHTRIRRTGIAIAILIGRDIYEELKIRDRRMLREIQRRVLKWLRHNHGASPAKSARAGIRLWQDAVGLANLLMQVSNRPELCEHDGQILVDVSRRLPVEDVGAGALPEETRDRLLALYGLDPDLDRCIDRAADCTLDEWRIAISNLLIKRGAEEPSGPPSPGPAERP